jgi:hypothetical protein
VFHLLVTDGTNRLIASQPPLLRTHARRAFARGEMKAACEFFAGAAVVDPKSAGTLVHLLDLPIEPELLRVATLFMQLQNARHRADYDQVVDFSRAEALIHVGKARQAFADWGSTRDKPNANVSWRRCSSTRAGAGERGGYSPSSCRKGENSLSPSISWSMAARSRQRKSSTARRNERSGIQCALQVGVGR